jgi:hypothetical protein
MIDPRVKELAAMMLIGDGVLALMYPRQHALLWKIGPQAFKNFMQAFADRPGLTQLLGAAEAGIGVWLASRQLSDVRENRAGVV